MEKQDWVDIVIKLINVGQGMNILSEIFQRINHNRGWNRNPNVQTLTNKSLMLLTLSYDRIKNDED